ncbi:unnamed protein product, partial [Cyprideis torosa]
MGEKKSVGYHLPTGKAIDTLMSKQTVTIIGGGLAGCEAAWQISRMGVPVHLHEMKPKRFSPAHEMESLAELVCSNSLRSDDPSSAVGLLKEEMRKFSSLTMTTAMEHRVPAGKALAVDRNAFSLAISKKLEESPLIQISRDEVTSLPPEETAPCIVASGPLTSESLTQSLMTITGKKLAFYDAIAPIVEADSLDMEIVYRKSRYDSGPGDYLNCPMDREEYQYFIEQLSTAQTVPLQGHEEQKYFEGCLPIEIMCARGENTPRFGPMKPVGLPDPRTGKDPYAVVQLRSENLQCSHYNMVGFQTKMTY